MANELRDLASLGTLRKKHPDVKFRFLINQGNKTKQWRPNILVNSLHLFYLQVFGPATAYWTRYI